MYSWESEGFMAMIPPRDDDGIVQPKRHSSNAASMQACDARLKIVQTPARGSGTPCRFYKKAEFSEATAETAC
jgi:hypothetical protein